MTSGIKIDPGFGARALLDQGSPLVPVHGVKPPTKKIKAPPAKMSPHHKGTHY